MQPALYSLFIETTAKHDTPVVVTPPPLRLAPLWKSARSQNPRSVYCWCNGAARRGGATLHSRRRIDRRGRKKRKKKRRSFIMELRNCKLSKYNGRPLARRPELAFCLCHRAPAAWPEYRITSNQSNSYLNETSNEKKFPGCSKRHLKGQEQYRLCFTRAHT